MLLHIDMDAFFAAVEQREEPRLRGRAVVVGRSPQARGVVAAANYAARAYGVRSAMPMARAVQKCPDLVIVKPNGALYQRVSREIQAIFYRYTPIIEPLSLDEAFLDPSQSEKLHGDAVAIGRRIKAAIYTELQLVASVGVAPNKLIAKLASAHDKPDGFTVIRPEAVQAFLDPMPVRKIWGVGKQTAARLTARGIETVLDLRQQSPQLLQDLFGTHGGQLWRFAHGIDPRAVTTDSEVKSISQETTFATDLREVAPLESAAHALAEHVGFRLRQTELQGRTVTLKVRYADFTTYTRRKTMPTPTDQTDVLWLVAKMMLRAMLRAQPGAIRLLGIGVSQFTAAAVDQQCDIFGSRMPSDEDGAAAVAHAKGAALDAVADQINTRFNAQSKAQSNAKTNRQIIVRAKSLRS